MKTITALATIVTDLKAALQVKQNEVISFNEQLKENAIKQTEQDINNLTNALFAIENRMENLTHSQENANQRLEQLNFDLQTNMESTVLVKELLQSIVSEVMINNEKLQLANNAFVQAQEDFNTANADYNNQQLQLTKQQSKLNSLQQELEFKNKPIK